MPQSAAMTFVLGKPPERSAVLPDVIDHLRGAGVTVDVQVPKAAERPILPADVDLVAIRGASRPVLEALTDADTAGLQWVNPPDAMLRLQDRDAVHQDLSRAGLPVPYQVRAESWEQVAAQVALGPAVVKAADGTVGRGRHVLEVPDGVAPADAPFPGPYVVAELVPSDGVDRKLYVIGSHVAGLAKPWPRPATGDGAEPLEVTEELARLARDTAETMNLTICGVDVLVGPRGPMIVDVNAFPSCKGVPHAASHIATHLIGMVN